MAAESGGVVYIVVSTDRMYVDCGNVGDLESNNIGPPVKGIR